MQNCAWPRRGGAGMVRLRKQRTPASRSPRATKASMVRIISVSLTLHANTFQLLKLREKGEGRSGQRVGLLQWFVVPHDKAVMRARQLRDGEEAHPSKGV